MLLEASGLDFGSILKGVGRILGGFWVVFGMDFRGYWVILDCSELFCVIWAFYDDLARVWQALPVFLLAFAGFCLALACFSFLCVALPCFALWNPF